MNDPAIITIIFIIAFTALLLSIKTFIDLQKLKKETEKQSEDTADDIQALRKKVVSIQTDCDSTDKIKVIEERLNKLERPMRIAASGKVAIIPVFSFVPKPVTPKIPKDGYFGAPKG